MTLAFSLGGSLLLLTLAFGLGGKGSCSSLLLLTLAFSLGSSLFLLALAFSLGSVIVVWRFELLSKLISERETSISLVVLLLIAVVWRFMVLSKLISERETSISRGGIVVVSHMNERV